MEAYINLNFFGRPVNCHRAAEIWLLLAIVLMYFCCIMCFNCSREMNIKEMRLTLWLKKLSFASFRPHTSLIRYEGYKIFITAGALPLLLVFSAFLAYSTGKSSYYVSSGEKRYASYMEYLEGPLTEEKASYLEGENDLYEEAMKQKGIIDEMEKNGEISPSIADLMRFPYERTLSFYGVFQRVWEKYQYIQSHPRAEFMYETGYMLLLGFSSDNAILRFLMLTVVLTLCLGNVYAMEYKHDMNRMISSTTKGRRRVSLCKLLISLIIGAFCCIAVETSYLIGITKAYPLPGIGSPVTSIMVYSKLPYFIPIWAFIGITAIVRLAASLASALIILLISRKFHSSLQGMFLSILVLGLSLILYIMGLPVAKWFGFLPLYMFPVFLTDSKGILVLCGYILGTGIICVGCIYSLRHAFSGADSNKKANCKGRTAVQ